MHHLCILIVRFGGDRNSCGYAGGPQSFIKKTGNQVEYSNTKGFIPGTGITMNTLPFAVVATVAVAGGAALVISRRRHAGEDF